MGAGLKGKSLDTNVGMAVLKEGSGEKPGPIKAIKVEIKHADSKDIK